MCVLQVGWRTQKRRDRRDKTSLFLGVGGGAADSKYVGWNRLDRSKPLENHLLQKVAGHLQKVVDLASTAKSCWVSEKM
jgi:hypothetical protein